MNEFFNRKRINVELTHICSLLCHACPRQTHWKTRLQKKIDGKVLSLENFTKIAKYFDDVHLCGQLSDPMHHPQLPEILKIARENNCNTKISTAVSLPSLEYYRECFDADPNAKWIFGIDGLPKDSHRYRVHQDGEKLFEIMIDCAKRTKRAPVWQYIMFAYNENNVDEAKDLAKKHGIEIVFMQSSRWDFKNNDGEFFKSQKSLPSVWKGKDTSILSPECFGSRPFGTDTWGRLIPCCRVDNLGNYEQDAYKKLTAVSNLDDYNNIEDILAQPEWTEFEENLKINKGLDHCHRACSTNSGAWSHCTDENSNQVLAP
jgi:hypothetical protein